MKSDRIGTTTVIKYTGTNGHAHELETINVEATNVEDGGKPKPVKPGKPSKEEKAAAKAAEHAAIRAALADVDDYPMNDSAAADRVLHRHGHAMMWCTATKMAYVFSSRGVWVSDPSEHALEQMIEETIHHCQMDLAPEIDNPEARRVYLSYMNYLLSARARSATRSILRTKLQNVAISDFDSRPHDFNCSNGTIDLRTGELQQHRAASLCTKQSEVKYYADLDPEVAAPVFMELLRWCMGGGKDASVEQQLRAEGYVMALQKWFGCCMTGLFEKLMAFLRGEDGDNGKSTVINAIRSVMGPYSAALQVDALLASKFETSNNINANLAQLAGVRMVTSSEPDADRPFNVNRIKALVGGGPTMGRSMRGNPVEFQTQFKLCLEINHQLTFTDSKEPVWNRVYIIPFLNTVAPGKRDTGLAAKLMKEREGILKWLVDGAVLYAELGMDFPKEWAVSKEKARVAVDHFPMFLEDSSISEPGAKGTVKDVRTTYELWCVNNAETPLSRHQFKIRMESHGYRQERSTINGSQVRVWTGIRLIKPTAGILARSLNLQ